jgi:hypothetical protein
MRYSIESGIAALLNCHLILQSAVRLCTKIVIRAWTVLLSSLRITVLGMIFVFECVWSSSTSSSYMADGLLGISNGIKQIGKQTNTETRARSRTLRYACT